jgi:hypothetical protein
MDPRDEAEIDGLLRQSMTAPVPTLSPSFEPQLMAKVRHQKETVARYHHFLLTGYGLTSAFASAVIMHSQGLAWTPISLSILIPCALVAATVWVRRATTHPTAS